MVNTKTLEETRANWKSSHAQVAQRYQKGIDRTQNWQEAAISGEENYAAGVTRAAQQQSRARAISGVSNESWKKAAKEKGATRIASGMAASEDKFASGMGRVLETIRNTELPARVQDGEQNVDNRLKPLVRNLQAMKRQ